jgi:hypothetical protein
VIISTPPAGSSGSKRVCEGCEDVVDPLRLPLLSVAFDELDPEDEPLLVCVGAAVMLCRFELPVAVDFVPDCAGEAVDCQHASID